MRLRLIVAAFCLSGCLSGCAWLQRPLDEAERAAREFALAIRCSELQTTCTPMAPGLYRCVYWAQPRRGREGYSDDPLWCKSTTSGTVRFRIVDGAR